MQAVMERSCTVLSVTAQVVHVCSSAICVCVWGWGCLSVCARSQELLPMVASGEDVSSAAVCITKTVYASPSRTEVNLASGKAHSEPQPSYPDIHFAGELTHV